MAAELFNVSVYLLDRRIDAGDGDRLAITGVAGDFTYEQLLERVERVATVLVDAGLEAEQRLMMFMADSPDFTAVYLAAMRIGAIPVPVSTMSNVQALGEMLYDSRARILAVTPDYAQIANDAVEFAPELRSILAAGFSEPMPASAVPIHDLEREIASAERRSIVYPTYEDSPAFWLYTSGTTGQPKGAMHRHGSIPVVCETYGIQVLGIRPDDHCLSVAKAFFAYGLGNSVLFPLSVGAATIFEPTPSKPDVIAERVQQYSATLFFAGPTFFANMLRVELPTDALAGVRLAASAGEALPGALYHRWTEHFGVDILDGIGMTEMLHIFLSNREGDVRPDTTGVAVPGYDLRIVDENGDEVKPGEPGNLLVRGGSTATGYWSRYDASRSVYQGEWLRTGDTYLQDSDGYYACLGRSNDMLKVSGIWVSPAEVEGHLLKHHAVASAVVVGALDSDGLERSIAYIVLRPGETTTEDELFEYCRPALAVYKRPRKVIFVDTIPTTATGKVRRVELREWAVNALVEETSPKEQLPREQS